MLSFLLMVLCFAVLTGIAMLIYALTRMTSVESIGVSVAATIIIQQIAGLLGSVFIGTVALYLAGLMGFIIFIVPKWMKKDRKAFFSPGLVMIAAGFAYSLIAFQGVFLHNWDEFIQWGFSAREMFETNLLPNMGANPAGSTLFHYFFVRTAGFLDSNLYTSGFLLIWTGMMLPLSSLKWQAWKTVLIYSAIMFLGQYALYFYPYMSIYVDMPVAAWAGGICALWYVRRDRKQILPLLLCALVLLMLFKWAVGPLFAVIVILFVLLISITSRQSTWKTVFKNISLFFKEKPYRIYAGIAALAVVIVAVVFFIIPKAGTILPGINEGSINELINMSSEKAQATLKAGIESVFTTDMGRSDLKVTYFKFMIALFVLAAVLSFFIARKKSQYRSISAFYFAGAAAYFFLLMFIYINTFPERESMRVASIQRYYAIYVVFGLIFLLSPLLLEDGQKKNRIVKTVISGAIILALVVGLNGSFINKYAFMLKPEKVSHYDDIQRIDSVSHELNAMLPKNAKVLMVIAQEMSALPVDVAHYKLLGKVPHTDLLPFTFLEGDNENKYLAVNVKLNDLPKYLMENGYSYIWVYDADDYFINTAAEVFRHDIENGVLYQFTSEKSISSLEYIGEF